ncbi:hypothetical protein [Streptosporangium sp. NPDC002524]
MRTLVAGTGATGTATRRTRGTAGEAAPVPIPGSVPVLAERRSA